MNKLALISNKFNITNKQVKIVNDLGNLCTYNEGLINDEH